MGEDNKLSFIHGFQSWSHLSRFLVSILITIFLLGFAVWSLLQYLRKAPNIVLEFTRGGATLINVNQKPSKALYLLAAGRLWANTGITLEPGQKVQVNASGYVNLAFHRLAESAVLDVKPRHAWIGPQGGPLKDETELDQKRRFLLIDNGTYYGTLLAYVCHQGDVQPGIWNPRPNGIQIINNNNDNIQNKGDCPGEIWLVVNDAVPSPTEEARKAYVTEQRVLNKVYGCDDYPECKKPKVTIEDMEERWEYIVRESYWDIWFDDNIGELLVQFDFSPEASFRYAGGTADWYCDTNKRLKTNIQTIENALEKVIALRGVQYEWIDTENHPEGKQIGFIAQEAVDIIPEVVEKNDGYYMMQYAPVTAILVEAMKEQQSQLEELKAENESLRQEIKQIIRRP